MHARDPLALLPLTHLAYHILLALADDPRHGYGIIKEVLERTDGEMELETGTLYAGIKRLRDALSGLRTRTVGAAITA
jgi:DNA-binding PadR family transcriptional regulator